MARAARVAASRLGLALLLGQSAQAHGLGDRHKAALTDTVHTGREQAQAVMPLPDPNRRNAGGFKANPSFDAGAPPAPRSRVVRGRAAGGQPPAK